MIQLRDYQARVFDSIKETASRGVKRILAVLPTGGGKSHIQAAIANSAIEKGKTVLSLMHRRGLVEQMHNVFTECGIDSGIIMAGVESELHHNCQIGSLLTYVRRIQLDDLEINRFFINADLLLIDEAHHVLSKTYQKILKLYPDKHVIGFTATPTLSTGAGLGNYFQEMVDVVPINELISGGHLVPGVYYGPTVPDLDNLKSVMGDFKKSDIDAKCNTPKLIGDIVENWLKIASDKQTMIFAITRKHAKALNQEFQKFGIKSEYLDAYNDDSERSDTIRRFKSGDTQVICQVALYTEGTDIPEIECLIDARPTRSLGFHRQKLGRGARPNKGKESFILIDHCGNVAGRKDSLGYYEDEVAWKLEGKPLSNRHRKKREKEKHLLICEMCSFVFSGKRCPQCGHEIKDYHKKIATLDAELKLLKKEKKVSYTTDEKRKFYGMLEYERRLRNYAEGWTAHKFKEKFNCWPKGFKNIAPIEPDQPFKNFLTYQRIRWAKRNKSVDRQQAIA
jgi:DNA repair protein RadD